MVVAQIRCNMCGALFEELPDLGIARYEFELEILDREDPEERQVCGNEITCPKGRRAETKVVQKIRKAK